MNGVRKRSVAKVFRARNVQRKNNKQRSKLWKNNEKNYYFKKFFGFMLWSRCSNFMACILLFSAKFSVLFPKWISAIVVAKFSVRTVWYDGHSFDVGHLYVHGNSQLVFLQYHPLKITSTRSWIDTKTWKTTW